MPQTTHEKKRQRHLPAHRAGEFTTEQRSRVDEILYRVEQLVANQQYRRAVDLLSSAGRDWQLINAKGVCLLRSGRFNEAIRLYRDLVLSPGCTWIRPDLPSQYVTNYATALLLGGHPGGCVEILAMFEDEQNPTVCRLRAALKQWESTLTLWQRLNWRFGRIAPENRPVTIDFEAGEFERSSANNGIPRPAGPRSPRQAA